MANEPRTLYIVLARGGSKRLPGKNLLRVGGVPLVGRAVRAGLQAARRLGRPYRVIVSTDDEMIAEAGRQWGGEVPFLRPADLASDAADSVAALRHAVDFYARQGETFTEIVLLQPTSPLRTADDVVRTLDTFRQRDGAPAVTVRPTAQHVADICFSLHNERLAALPSAGAARDMAQVELNGAVYVCAPDWLRDPGRFCIPGRTWAVMMPPARSIDVDTASDLERAQAAWERSLLWRPGRCLIIAEAGVNHDGSLETARRLVDAAREAGADAVKFQAFAAERLVTRAAAKAAYQRQTTAPDETQFAMLKRLELPPDDLRSVATYAAERGITFLSSPFGEPDVDLLDALDVPAIKIGSGEITNHPLLAHVGRTLRPAILSTGASTLAEVMAAVDVLRGSGCADLAVLHCVSNYPADPADANLRAMETIARALNVPVGFSDHTPGIEVACAAVALGARILEKHLTLDRNLPGPDHAASLDPADFARLVSAVRHLEAALGDGVKRPTAGETDVRTTARRSLVAAADLPAGTVLRREHLAAKRPGTGIAPAHLPTVLGLRLERGLAADELLTWAHLRPEADGCAR